MGAMFRFIPILMLLFVLWGNQALAQETTADDAGHEVISGIEITGLERTRESYVLAELSHYVGRSVKEISIDDVKTDLQRIGLFDEIEVSISPKGNQAYLDISVKEKWSLIPIPMLSYIEEVTGGLFFMDMNAFGLNDKFMIGAIGSKSKFRAMAMFSTPALVGKTGLSFFGSGAKDKDRIYDANKHTVLKYNSVNYMIGAKLTYKISLNSSASVGANYSLSYNEVTYNPRETRIDKHDRNMHALSVNGGYVYEKSEWNGWFMSSIRIHLDADLTLINADTVSPDVWFGVSYQKPLFVDRFRVLAHASGYYAWQSTFPLYKKARLIGVDILPPRFRSSSMYGGGAGLETGIYRFAWASLSIGAQYQIVCLQDWDKKYAFHHGWVGAVNVNLSKIAFPAFSMGVAQDVSNGRFYFALGSGMSM